MKVLTILGTRPEIIRLSRIVERLDQQSQHVLVHTGQNYDAALSDVFFHELQLRTPDQYLGVRGATFAERIGQILTGCETALRTHQPDRLVVLGDTDSALAAFVAKRLGVPVYHLEAGNRCYDDRVPEEVNRRVIDQCSDVLLPYTARSRENLLREGIAPNRIYVSGNPIFEVMEHHRSRIDRSTILTELNVAPGAYFLLTAHRQENVDVEARLRALVAAVQQVAREHALPVIASVHPRTRDRLTALGLFPERVTSDRASADAAAVRWCPPFGFADFLRLERDARCVLTDSGTVQEECCILGVPSVTLRDTTERPETVECGSNVLSGVDPAGVARGVRIALSRDRSWRPPAEYLASDVSSTVTAIVLGV